MNIEKLAGDNDDVGRHNSSRIRSRWKGGTNVVRCDSGDDTFGKGSIKNCG